MRIYFVLGILFVLVLSGCENGELENDEVNKEFELDSGELNEEKSFQEINLEKGMLLFSKENFETEQQDIFSYNIESEEKIKVTSIDTFFDDIAYYQNKIYFINADSKIESFNLKNGEKEVLDIKNVGSFFNFIISDDNIIYIGHSDYSDSSRSYKFLLGRYNIINYNNEIVIDENDILTQMEGFSLGKYISSKDILGFSVGFGGGGGGRSAFYQINFDDNNIKHLGTADFESCGELSGVNKQCTDEINEKNKKYEDLKELSGSNEELFCNEVSVDDLVFELENLGNDRMNYVGCVE